MNMAATTRTAADAARLPLMLGELRLPTMKRLWADLAEQSNREGWTAERFLGTLLEQEVNERETRRLARARVDSHLPPDKSLASFDFDAVTTISKAHITLAEADGWIAQGHNLLAFGPPRVGKTHLIAGIGHALIGQAYKVLFVRTSELVQRLQAAHAPVISEQGLGGRWAPFNEIRRSGAQRRGLRCAIQSTPSGAASDLGRQGGLWLSR